MNQETVNAFYGRLEELRNTFDEYLVAHDTPEGEQKVKAVLALLSASIETLS